VPEALARHERYRVVRLLGEGGMGSVYEAEQLVMQRRVALKVIHRAYTANPAAVERFRREVRVAARLAHPNIVTAYDAETAGDSHFLVMEYVEGVSLARLVRERGPLPVAEACAYVRQAALGLQHAHERGLVHRDVKPDNLIRCADGTVKVLDFGLAALTAERGAGLTEENVVMGTPDYMAPEQAEDSRSADIRADLYSLGCTLYYLLTGKAPYPAPTPLLKVLAHREQPVPSVREARPDVPRELAAVVGRLLAKRPEDRYQTPGEVAAALEPFTRTSNRAQQRPGSKRGWLAAVALLFLGLIAAAGVVFYIKTDNGTIEIQTDDENVKIIAERNGKQITVLDPKSKQTWVVDTGEWTVRLDGNPDGLKIEMPNNFTLKRGDKQVVTVKRVKGPDVVVKPPGEVKTGFLRTLPVPSAKDYSPMFSPNGRLVAIPVDGAPFHVSGLNIHDVATGEQVSQLKLAGGEHLTSHVFTADGKRLILGVASPKEDSFGFRECDVATGESRLLEQVPRVAEWPTYFHLSGDGTRLAYGWGMDTRVIDLKSGKTLLETAIPAEHRQGGAYGYTHLSPDGKRAFTIQGWGKHCQLRINDIDNKKTLTTRVLDQGLSARDTFVDTVTGRFGGVFSTAEKGYRVDYFDSSTGKVVQQVPLGEEGKSVWWFAALGGRRFAAWENGGPIRIKDFPTGKEVFRTDPIARFDNWMLSEDGQMLLIRVGSEVKLYRLPDPPAAKDKP
jgi:serine/threonine protein kinase